MKYATKLMVVPYVPKLENPSEKYLVDLDSEMSKVLNDKNLQIDQKVKLYNQTLQRFMVNYDSPINATSTVNFKPIESNENEIKKEKEDIKQDVKEENKISLDENLVSIKKTKKKKSNESQTKIKKVKRIQDKAKKPRKVKFNSSSYSSNILDQTIQPQDISNIEKVGEISLFGTPDTYNTNKKPINSPSRILSRKKPNLVQNLFPGLSNSSRIDNPNTVFASSDILNKTLGGSGLWKSKKFFK